MAVVACVEEVEVICGSSVQVYGEQRGEGEWGGVTHKILFILEVSSEMIMRFSPSGHSTAPDTVVPPPNGMMTTLCASAARTIASTYNNKMFV